MRFVVPAQVTIEASSPERALAMAREIQKLLDEPMVKSVLQANGVAVQQIQVFQPTPSR
jgi:hypothetical protein